MPLQNKQFIMPVMRKPSKIDYGSGYTQQLQPFNHYRKTLDCDCKGEDGWVEIIRNNCCRPTTKSATTVLNKNYYTTAEEYNYARCKTYSQRSTIVRENGETKSTCTTGCKVVYNPNNKQFSQQGATSSSNRLQRLKYNTLASRGKYLTGTVNRSLKDGRQNCKGIHNIHQNKTICK